MNSDNSIPIKKLVEEVIETAERMRPRIASTYRLQFHTGFTFNDAARIIPYLHDLGITHVYASPYLKATSGSTHGYDVVDPTMLNPELGTEEDYQCFVSELQRHGMGQILDLVPNHMGVASNENKWWNDLLACGPSSPYAFFFDIDWMADPERCTLPKVILPVLGDTYGIVLKRGDIKLIWHEGAFSVQYGQRHFPLSIISLLQIFKSDAISDSLRLSSSEMVKTIEKLEMDNGIA